MALDPMFALPEFKARAQDLGADGKHLEPDPDEQAVLDEIRRLRQSGATLRGIRRSAEPPRASDPPRFRLAA